MSTSPFDITPVVSASSVVPSQDGIPIQCDWVGKFRNSGAETQVNNILGNTFGFIQEYWWIITAIFLLIAVLTLVFARNRQSGAFKGVIVVCVAGFLLPAAIGLGVSLNPGPC